MLQYVQSCAITAQYSEDWTDECKATLNDVKGHASAIFEDCQYGASDTVGGFVPFAMPNCPAMIDIIRADGQPPQGGLRR